MGLGTPRTSAARRAGSFDYRDGAGKRYTAGMLTRSLALLLALALPASSQVRTILPSAVFSAPAVRLAPPTLAPLPLSGTLAAPLLAPSVVVPDLPPAFADGRALFDGAPADAPASAAAPASPRGATLRFNGVALKTRLFSDQDKISAALIKAIDATQDTLEIAIHGLALREVAAALKRAKDRGVRIRIVMNQTHVFPEKERDTRSPEVQMLLDEGFDMRVLRGGDLFGVQHNKIAVFDGKLLETGSYNWTAAADRQHWENVVFMDEADRVAAFAAYWKWLWERSTVADPANPPAKPVLEQRPDDELRRGADLPPAPMPSTRRVRFNAVELPGEAFSPWNAEPDIIKALDAAKVSIDAANFSFTSAAIRDALLRAKDRGVAVRLALDANQYDFLKEMRELVALGFDVRLSKGKDGQRGVQHNKMAVLDGKLVQTGSHNWTNNGHKNNYENALFLDAPDDVAAYAAFFERIWDQGFEPPAGASETHEFLPEGAVPAPGDAW